MNANSMESFEGPILKGSKNLRGKLVWNQGWGYIDFSKVAFWKQKTRPKETLEPKDLLMITTTQCKLFPSNSTLLIPSPHLNELKKNFIIELYDRLKKKTYYILLPTKVTFLTWCRLLRISIPPELMDEINKLHSNLNQIPLEDVPIEDEIENEEDENRDDNQINKGNNQFNIPNEIFVNDTRSVVSDLYSLSTSTRKKSPTYVPNLYSQNNKFPNQQSSFNQKEVVKNTIYNSTQHMDEQNISDENHLNIDQSKPIPSSLSNLMNLNESELLNQIKLLSNSIDMGSKAFYNKSELEILIAALAPTGPRNRLVDIIRSQCQELKDADGIITLDKFKEIWSTIDPTETNNPIIGTRSGTSTISSYHHPFPSISSNSSYTNPINQTNVNIQNYSKNQTNHSDQELITITQPLSKWIKINNSSEYFNEFCNLEIFFNNCLLKNSLNSSIIINPLIKDVNVPTTFINLEKVFLYSTTYLNYLLNVLNESNSSNPNLTDTTNVSNQNPGQPSSSSDLSFDWYGNYLELINKIETLEDVLNKSIRNKNIKESLQILLKECKKNEDNNKKKNDAKLTSNTTLPTESSTLPLSSSSNDDNDKMLENDEEIIKILNEELVSNLFSLSFLNSIFNINSLIGSKIIINELLLPNRLKTIKIVKKNKKKNYIEYKYKGIYLRFLSLPLYHDIIKEIEDNEDQIMESDGEEDLDFLFGSEDDKDFEDENKYEKLKRNLYQKKLKSLNKSYSINDNLYNKIITKECLYNSYLNSSFDLLLTEYKLMQNSNFVSSQTDSSKLFLKNWNIRKKFSTIISYSGFTILAYVPTKIDYLSSDYQQLSSNVRDKEEYINLIQRGQSLSSLTSSTNSTSINPYLDLFEKFLSIKDIGESIKVLKWKNQQEIEQRSSINDFHLPSMASNLNLFQDPCSENNDSNSSTPSSQKTLITLQSENLFPSYLPRPNTYDIFTNKIRPELLNNCDILNNFNTSLPSSYSFLNSDKNYLDPKVVNNWLEFNSFYYQRHLVTISSKFDGGILLPYDSSSLTSILHSEGVRLNSLGILYKLCKMKWIKSLILNEIISRSCKNLFKSLLRNLTRNYHQQFLLIKKKLTKKDLEVNKSKSNEGRGNNNNGAFDDDVDDDDDDFDFDSSNINLLSNYNEIIEEFNKKKLNLILDFFNIIFFPTSIKNEEIISNSQNIKSLLLNHRKKNQTDSSVSLLFFSHLEEIIFAKFGLKFDHSTLPKLSSLTLFNEWSINRLGFFNSLQFHLNIRFKDSILDIINSTNSSGSNLKYPSNLPSNPISSTFSSSTSNLTSLDIIEAFMPSVNSSPSVCLVRPGLTWCNIKEKTKTVRFVGIKTASSNSLEEDLHQEYRELNQSKSCFNPVTSRLENQLIPYQNSFFSTGINPTSLFSGQFNFLLHHAQSFLLLKQYNESSSLYHFLWLIELKLLSIYSKNSILNYKQLIFFTNLTFFYSLSELLRGKVEQAYYILQEYFSSSYLLFNNIHIIKVLMLLLFILLKKNSDKKLIININNNLLVIFNNFLPKNHPLFFIPINNFYFLYIHSIDLFYFNFFNKKNDEKYVKSLSNSSSHSFSDFPQELQQILLHTLNKSKLCIKILISLFNNMEEDSKLPNSFITKSQSDAYASAVNSISTTINSPNSTSSLIFNSFNLISLYYKLINICILSNNNEEALQYCQAIEKILMNLNQNIYNLTRINSEIKLQENEEEKIDESIEKKDFSDESTENLCESQFTPTGPLYIFIESYKDKLDSSIESNLNTNSLSLSTLFTLILKMKLEYLNLSYYFSLINSKVNNKINKKSSIKFSNHYLYYYNEILSFKNFGVKFIKQKRKRNSKCDIDQNNISLENDIEEEELNVENNELNLNLLNNLNNSKNFSLWSFLSVLLILNENYCYFSSFSMSFFYIKIVYKSYKQYLKTLYKLSNTTSNSMTSKSIINILDNKNLFDFLIKLSLKYVENFFYLLPYNNLILIQLLSEEWNIFYNNIRKNSLASVSSMISTTPKVNYSSLLNKLDSLWDGACQYLIEILWRNELKEYIICLIKEIQNQINNNSSSITSSSSTTSPPIFSSDHQYNYPPPVPPLPLEVQASALYLILQEPLGFAQKINKS